MKRRKCPKNWFNLRFSNQCFLERRWWWHRSRCEQLHPMRPASDSCAVLFLRWMCSVVDHFSMYSSDPSILRQWSVRQKTQKKKQRKKHSVEKLFLKTHKNLKFNIRWFCSHLPKNRHHLGVFVRIYLNSRLEPFSVDQGQTNALTNHGMWHRAYEDI